MLLSFLIRFSGGRAVAAVVAALLAAALLVQFDSAPGAVRPSVAAGEDTMQMLRDEHAAIASYLKDEVQAQTMANQSAARDMERMKLAALEEAQPATPRVAQAIAPARAEKVKTGIVRVAVKSEPVRATTGSAVASEPMQLLAMTDAEAMQAPRPPGIVRGRLRQFASTVERFPSWFNAAAGWVVDAVPVPKVPSLPSLPQLPMRHFRV